MRAPAGTVFEVRYDDLPDRPALARTEDYESALRAVDRLNEAFADQLQANGEGVSRLAFRLRVVQLSSGRLPRLRYLSSTNGHR